MPNLIIVEVKQERFSQKSDFIKLMHEFLTQPTGFSKYCIGIAIILDELKHNNFKEKLLLVQKITGEVI